MECLALTRLRLTHSFARSWSRQHALLRQLPLTNNNARPATKPTPPKARSILAAPSSLRFLSTESAAGAGSVATTTSSTSPFVATSAATSSQTPQVATNPPAIDRFKLTYHVSRSVNNNLPIYSERKGHGTLRLTVVRKVSGDATALKKDLIDYLQVSPKDAAVVQPANYVRIKGQHTGKVQKFLLERGF